jgi:membrane associated rhomboid family serine protease
VTAPASGGDAAAVPVCPRHPDRESYVRCQRCDRPVCPECQRPAAVGIQCVDCVREQAKGVRTARTPFGGVAVAGRPVVTQVLIALCVVAYLLQKLPDSTVTQDFAFSPVYATAEPWRLLTAAFLHAPSQPLHILFNMYALWLTGPYLESLLGRLRFVLLYLISAVGGSVGYLVLAHPGQDSWFTSTVGASGAVFGLFGAFFVVQRRLGRDAGPVIAMIVINLAFSFLPNVAWQAHLGGLVTGVAAAAVLVYAPRENRSRVQFGGLAALSLIVLVAFVVKVATVPTGLLA